MMGLITLMFVQFSGNKGRLGGKTATIKSSRALVLREVALGGIGDTNTTTVASITNAKEYASSTGIDFYLVGSSWGSDISGLLSKYPDGILLVESSPGWPMQRLSLDKDYFNVGDGDDCQTIVGIKLRNADSSLVDRVSSQKEWQIDQRRSAVAACAEQKNRIAVVCD